MAILALIHSAAEYWAPVWCCSKHTRLVDKPIQDALQLVTGCLRATPINNLFVLAVRLLLPLYFTEKVLHCLELPCYEPRAPSPWLTLVHTNSRTQIDAPILSSAFVPAALVLLKNLDKSNTTAAFWADHKSEVEYGKAEKYFLPSHIYSISWPLTTRNYPT